MHPYNGTLAALSQNPGWPGQIRAAQREDANDSRRCSEIDQRKRGEVRRSCALPTPRQGAARHHPDALVDEGFFKDGKMFDGSSIAGWKGINESDMILMPDPEHGGHRSVLRRDHGQLRCDVIEPMTMQGYERDPRSLAKRAEAYLKSSGIADSRCSVPRTNSSFSTASPTAPSMNGCSYEVDSYEGAWNSGKEYEDGNKGHRPGHQGRLLPGAAGRCQQDIRTAMSWPAKRWA
jgi:glutamine synthetase